MEVSGSTISTDEGSERGPVRMVVDRMGRLVRRGGRGGRAAEEGRER